MTVGVITMIIQCDVHVTGIYEIRKSACFGGYEGVLSVEWDCWYSCIIELVTLICRILTATC